MASQFKRIAAAPSSSSTTGTHSVKRLLLRHRELTGCAGDSGQWTDTASIMMRVEAAPVVVLSLDDATARERIEAVLTEMQIGFLSGPTADAGHEVPADAPVVLMTDDLQLVASVREDRSEPRIHILFVAPDDSADLGDALVAGADDCVSHSAPRQTLRARILVTHRRARMETSFRSIMRENRKLSTTDELTKVANRHFFARHFPLEVERAARLALPLALVACDIDHFKRVNDTYGHPQGDRVLTEFAGRVLRCLRAGTDWVARVGGEEFLIVLPETSLEKATLVARKIREEIRGRHFRIEGQKIGVTASFGVCGIPPETEATVDVMRRAQATADAALYRSKHEGRDRVTFASIVNARKV